MSEHVAGGEYRSKIASRACEEAEQGLAPHPRKTIAHQRMIARATIGAAQLPSWQQICGVSCW
jgi:hypothetical protein